MEVPCPGFIEQKNRKQGDITEGVSKQGRKSD